MTEKTIYSDLTDEHLAAAIEHAFDANAVPPAVRKHRESYITLTRMLLEFNSHTNITAITDPARLAVLHYCDSLTVAAELGEGARVADIGCGGGFPTLPLAIARPDLSITAIDSTAKKLKFVDAAAAALELAGVRTLPIRAENGGHDPVLRESFDHVTARAVASLPVLCELCLPYLRVGGTFCAMKGPRGDDEAEAARRAIETLGGKLCAVRRPILRGIEDETPERTIIIIRKISETPKTYPRAYGKIKQKPLI